MRRAGPMLLALAVVLSATSCGDEGGEIPEWRPEDHQQPAQPDPARTPASGETPEQTIARAAATLFQSSCASCHGADGRGGGASAPPGAQMPDLSAASFHDGNTDAQIAQVIANGRGMMPAFGQQLNERGIAALVGHIRTLRED